MAWALVYTTNTEFDALVIEGMLLAHDIPAQVLSQVDTTRGFTVGDLAVAKVFVPTEHVIEAEALIAKTLSNKSEELGD